MTDAPADDSKGSTLFCVLACALTWALAVPAILAWRANVPPPPFALACAGLSAFGPTIAATLVAAPQRRLREVFGRWRTNVLWVIAVFFVPMAVHVAATALARALGGPPTPWIHPPQTPENVAAMVVFPLGEEFGWRGFLQPRMERRFGVLRGSLIVGVVWVVWHFAYSWTPPTGQFDPSTLALNALLLLPYSVVMGWVLQRTRSSMAIAIAFHAGAHFDHLEREPFSNLRLHGLALGIAWLLGIAAAWSLARREKAVTAAPA